jgi:hypothetical protein
MFMVRAASRAILPVLCSDPARSFLYLSYPGYKGHIEALVTDLSWLAVPGVDHLARGGRFVDRRLERSGQGTTGPRQQGGRDFLKFSFFSGNAKICEKKHPSSFEAVGTGHK